MMPTNDGSSEDREARGAERAAPEAARSEASFEGGVDPAPARGEESPRRTPPAEGPTSNDLLQDLASVGGVSAPAPLPFRLEM